MSLSSTRTGTLAAGQCVGVPESELRHELAPDLLDELLFHPDPWAFAATFMT